jgi:hypothetical protein
MTDDIFHPSSSKWRRTYDSLSLSVVSIRLEPLNASVLGGTGAAILCSVFTNGSSNRDHAIRTPPSTPSGGTVQRQRVDHTYLLQCARLFSTGQIPARSLDSINQTVPSLSCPIPIPSYICSYCYFVGPSVTCNIGHGAGLISMSLVRQQDRDGPESLGMGGRREVPVDTLGYPSNRSVEGI